MDIQSILDILDLMTALQLVMDVFMRVIQHTGKWLARLNKFPVATTLACYELAQLMCSYLTKKKVGEISYANK